ncbi:MAG: toxin [Legionellaceae bacterium]|nr:toxin [Legionellaceae bacterium]
MNFEYDSKKSAANKLKHGIGLEEAQMLWFSPAVEVEAKTVGEPRFMIIGKVKGKFYSCIYTIRGDFIRLISARRSRKSEERIYNEHIKG